MQKVIKDWAIPVVCTLALLALVGFLATISMSMMMMTTVMVLGG